jgi:hypothetical protein
VKLYWRWFAFFGVLAVLAFLLFGARGGSKPRVSPVPTTSIPIVSTPITVSPVVVPVSLATSSTLGVSSTSTSTTVLQRPVERVDNVVYRDVTGGTVALPRSVAALALAAVEALYTGDAVGVRVVDGMSIPVPPAAIAEKLANAKAVSLTVFQFNQNQARLLVIVDVDGVAPEAAGGKEEIPINLVNSPTGWLYDPTENNTK